MGKRIRLDDVANLYLNSISVELNNFAEVVVPTPDQSKRFLEICDQNGLFNVQGLNGRVRGVYYKGKTTFSNKEITHYIPYSQFRKAGEPNRIRQSAIFEAFKE